MKEELQRRAESILDILNKQPELGADLLIDFAKNYAANPRLEDEVILAKLQLVMSKEGGKKNEHFKIFEALANSVVENYNQEALSLNKAKEAILAERFKKLNTPNDLVLYAKNIRKSYPKWSFTLQLDKLELRLGQITGIVGQNANGKTTLFQILAGELGIDEGELEYPFLNYGNKLSWIDIKSKIAYVPQIFTYSKETLLETLQYEASKHGVLGKENKKAVEYVIQRLGLMPFINKKWYELSGGYKFRFELAKALVWSPKVLILDEPLAFLDFNVQLLLLNDLKNLVSSIQYPISILISSQHVYELEKVADQMFFLNNGKLENLGFKKDWGENRVYNMFELSAPISFDSFKYLIQNFGCIKYWHNGVNWVIVTSINITRIDLLKYLATNDVYVDYFYDISSSVKSKFYEEYL